MGSISQKKKKRGGKEKEMTRGECRPSGRTMFEGKLLGGPSKERNEEEKRDRDRTQRWRWKNRGGMRDRNGLLTSKRGFAIKGKTKLEILEGKRGEP